MTSAPITVLYSASLIDARVQALATEIGTAGYDRLVVVALLKGSFIFAADLLRALHGVGLEPEVDFMTISSYGAEQVSSGNLRVLRDIETDVAGRDVLIVDDILESGRTISHAKALMLERGARSADVVVLLEKPGKRKVEIDADYIGFICPDKFVVGYGMDAGHAWRQLPYVGVIEETGNGG